MIDAPTAVLASRAGGGEHALEGRMSIVWIAIDAFTQAILPRIVRMYAFPQAILPRIVRMHAFPAAVWLCIVRMHAFPAAVWSLISNRR